MANIIKVLNKVSNSTERIEALYVNPLLLDTLFGDLFGGVTRILQSIEKSSDKELKIEGTAGIKNSILSLFLELKAYMLAKGKIGEHARSLIEKELTVNKKIKLCETALLDSDLIIDNPSLQSVDHSKFTRFNDKFSMFVKTDEPKIKDLFNENEKAAEAVIRKWKRDQSLTPHLVQVALASNNPFPMYGIIQIQSGLNGSTYIGSPPFPRTSRSVLAQVGFEEDGIYFLKIYWVVDKQPPLGT